MITLMRTYSTLQASVDGRRQVADLSRQLNQAGEEATTGYKSDRFRALGSRAGEAMATRARLDRLESFATINATLDRRLEMTGSSLGDMRASLQTVLDLAVPSTEGHAFTGAQLQAAARAALDQVIGQVNRSYEGVSLFSGVANTVQAIQPYDTVNPASGLSPRGMVETAIGAMPVDAAQANAKADALAAIFDPAATGAATYRETVYNGAARDMAGKGMSVRIDEEEVLDYGVQADDPAFSEMLRGLSMLASVDISTLDDQAAQAWTSRAFEALENGRTGLLSAETRIGAQRRQLEDTMESQAARVTLYRQQIDSVEGVDPYEAATRLTQLQTQLEASYAITARLSKLSFLNYM